VSEDAIFSPNNSRQMWESVGGYNTQHLEV